MMKKILMMAMLTMASVLPAFGNAKNVLIKFEGTVKANGYHVVYDDANSNVRWNGKETFEQFAKRCKGKPTIGYGSTNKNLLSKCRITEEEAVAELMTVIVRIEKKIDETVKVNLNRNQRDALISFIYNIGFANFKASTLLKKLNQGDFSGASEEFVRWKFVTVGGKKVVSTGLLNRRNAERNLFMLERTVNKHHK